MATKFLAIDYGNSKIGLAMGNSEEKLALPFKIFGEEEFWSNIKDIIKEEQIDEIVLGLPTNMNSEETEQTGFVRNFLDKLRKEFDLPIHFEDERMTSLLSQKMMRIPGQKTRKDDDASAAALILDSFLKRHYGF